MQPQAGTARSSARPSRILIVDDHEVSRAALRALLRTEGIDVADMRTGGAAVTAAIAFRPDVVVVDVTPADPAGFLIARPLQVLPDGPRDRAHLQLQSMPVRLPTRASPFRRQGRLVRPLDRKCADYIL